MVFSSIINLFRLIGMHWHRHIDTRRTPYLILQDLAGAGLLRMGSTPTPNASSSREVVVIYVHKG